MIAREGGSGSGSGNELLLGRSVAARGHGGSGAPHKSALPPPALAGGKVDSVLSEAAASPSAAAGGGGGGSISALEKVSLRVVLPV